MTTPDQKLTYTGTLDLKDGAIHFVNDQNMPVHYGGYHPKSGTVIYGGDFEMIDPLTFRIGQRHIRIETGERHEITSKLGELDAWHNMNDDDPSIPLIPDLITTLRVLNPETRNLIGTTAASELTAIPEAEDSRKFKTLTVRMRLAHGVSLRLLPRGGMTLQPDGNFSDAEGNLIFVRAEAGSGPQYDMEAAAHRPAPPAEEEKPKGFWGRLGRMVQGE